MADRSLLFAFTGVGVVSWGFCAVLESSEVMELLFSREVYLHGLVIHLPLFALGAIASWVRARGVSAWRRFLSGAALIGFVALLMTSTVRPVALSIPASRYAFPLAPTVFATIVLSATEVRWIQRLLSSRWLVLGGTISYAFYLVHLPIMRIANVGLSKLGITPSILVLGLGSFVLSSFAAWGLTITIEQPLRRLLVQPAESAHDG